MNQLVSLELRINAQTHAEAGETLLRKLMNDPKIKMSEEARDDLALVMEDLHRACVYLKILNSNQQAPKEEIAHEAA